MAGADLDAELLVQTCGGVVTAEQAAKAGWSRGSVRAALNTGRLIRLRQGVYTSARTWAQADAARRQRLILLAHQRITPNLMGWGRSAAAALGLPLPDEPLTAIPAMTRPDLRLPRPGEKVFGFPDGTRITSVTQIIIDCARILPIEWGLAVADAALYKELITPEEIGPADQVAPVEGLNGPRGIRRARWVLEHARDKVESPLESLARALIILGGFAEPLPQQWITTALGGFRVDLLDEENRVITEADGKVKYEDGQRRTVWEEKGREDALRDRQFEVVRFTMADYYHREEFWARYRAALKRGRRLLR